MPKLYFKNMDLFHTHPILRPIKLLLMNGFLSVLLVQVACQTFGNEHAERVEKQLMLC